MFTLLEFILAESDGEFIKKILINMNQISSITPATNTYPINENYGTKITMQNGNEIIVAEKYSDIKNNLEELRKRLSF